MAERAIPRVTRLLGIVTHLEEHGEASFAELAAHFEVSDAVIKRDVETLWVAGLPGYGTNDLLDFDGWAYDQGIARLINSQGVHQVRLAPSEAVSLMAALGSMVSSGAAPPAAASALDKLGDAIAGAAQVTVIPVGSVDPAITSTLTEAAGATQAVEVDYVDAKDRRTTRVIEPHRLVTIDGLGYVECYCHRASDYRTLRLDRIASVTATGTDFTAPTAGRPGFALDAAYDARIEIAAAGRWAFEDLPGAVVEPTEGGLVEVRVGVSNPEVVVARMLSVGPALRSVSPRQLAEHLRAAAQAVLASAI